MCPPLFFRSARNHLPELPFSGKDNIDGKREVGDGVSRYTLDQAAAFIEQQIVEDAGHYSGQNVVVLQAEQYDRDQKRCPGKGTYSDGVEILVNDVADQK